MTPEDTRLARRIVERPLVLDEVIEWLATVPAEEFVPRDACYCPVALFLKRRHRAKPDAIEVGDDDISVNGHYVEPVPTEIRAFVNWFDSAFDDAEECPTGAQVLERWHARSAP